MSYTITIDDKEYQVPPEVGELLKSVSLERDKMLELIIEQQETADARECPCRLRFKEILSN